jgi:hypothetical protein
LPILKSSNCFINPSGKYLITAYLAKSKRTMNKTTANGFKSDAMEKENCSFVTGEYYAA